MPALVVCLANATTLDDYFDRQGIGGLDLVKVDVEGAEPLLIKGAKRILESEDAPDIIVEVNPQRLLALGFTADYLLAMLGSLGYSLYLIRRRGLVPISEGFSILKAASLLATKSDWVVKMREVS